MKIHCLLTLFLFVFIALPFHALSQNNEAYVKASLSLDRNYVFEKETVKLTLLLEFKGVRLSQRMRLSNMPDKTQLEILSDFDEFPAKKKIVENQIVEVRRYVSYLRSLKSGTITIDPLLRVNVLRRRALFIGHRTEEVAHEIKVAPVTLTIKPIPPPEEYMAYSGAVGDFDLTVKAQPTDVAVGDLIAITMQIKGKGFLDNISPPNIAPDRYFRMYEPKLIKSTPDEALYEQVLVPLNKNAAKIPSVSFVYFDPNSERYKTLISDEIPLRFHKTTKTTFKQFKPEEAFTKEPAQSLTHTSNRTNDNSSENESPSFVSRLTKLKAKETATTIKATDAHLAPSPSSLKTFELPAGSTINILQIHNNWRMIEFKNKRGWVPAEGLN